MNIVSCYANSLQSISNKWNDLGNNSSMERHQTKCICSNLYWIRIISIELELSLFNSKNISAIGTISVRLEESLWNCSNINWVKQWIGIISMQLELSLCNLNRNRNYLCSIGIISKQLELHLELSLCNWNNHFAMSTISMILLCSNNLFLAYSSTLDYWLPAMMTNLSWLVLSNGLSG